MNFFLKEQITYFAFSLSYLCIFLNFILCNLKIKKKNIKQLKLKVKFFFKFCIYIYK